MGAEREKGGESGAAVQRFPWDGILRPCSAVVVRLDRTTQYAAAHRLNRWRLWNTGSPAFAGDDIE